MKEIMLLTYKQFNKIELKKLKDAIEMFQKKIKKQGSVTNARDEEHLKNLIKVYKQMGGKGVRESVNEAPTGVKSMGGNMTGAIKRIEKMKKGLSKQKDVKKAIRMANESINETPYELGVMKVYSKADGLKKVKSMKKTAGAKIYKVTKTKTKLYGTIYNV